MANSVIVSTAGETITISYTLTTGAPVLPTLNEITWASLSPVAGEHLGITLKRATSNARVAMPAGTFYIIDDADLNNYSVFSPKTLGLRGAGIDKTILQLKPNTFSVKTTRPNQSCKGVIRLGPNSSTVQQQRTMSDLTIIGAEELGTDGLPMFFGGYINYYGYNETWQNVKIVGLNYGGGNSPATGETFGVNMLHDVNSSFYNVEIDGRDINGNRVAGSPLGCNGSQNVFLQDCYFHDSLFSGLTFSVAGSVASPTNIVTTNRVRVAQNANHTPLVSGGRFSGFNHEFVTGKITHTQPDILLDNAALWDSSHMSFGGTNGDNPNIEIIAPVWHGASPTWTNGAFTVKMYQDQVTPPVVKNSDGSLKTPIIVSGQSPAHQNIDPDTQYAVSVGTGYVAP
jgi:hypothetical protein